MREKFHIQFKLCKRQSGHLVSKCFAYNEDHNRAGIIAMKNCLFILGDCKTSKAIINIGKIFFRTKSITNLNIEISSLERPLEFCNTSLYLFNDFELWPLKLNEINWIAIRFFFHTVITRRKFFIVIDSWCLAIFYIVYIQIIFLRAIVRNNKSSDEPYATHN